MDKHYDSASEHYFTSDASSKNGIAQKLRLASMVVTDYENTLSTAVTSTITSPIGHYYFATIAFICAFGSTDIFSNIINGTNTLASSLIKITQASQLIKLYTKDKHGVFNNLIHQTPTIVNMLSGGLIDPHDVIRIPLGTIQGGFNDAIATGNIAKSSPRLNRPEGFVDLVDFLMEEGTGCFICPHNANRSKGCFFSTTYTNGQLQLFFPDGAIGTPKTKNLDSEHIQHFKHVLIRIISMQYGSELGYFSAHKFPLPLSPPSSPPPPSLGTKKTPMMPPKKKPPPVAPKPKK